MIEQVMIALTGATAVYLTQQSREGWKKYACLFGMAGQPFWIYATYPTEQWGMFALTLFYTWSWWLGIKNNWLPKTNV